MAVHCQDFIKRKFEKIKELTLTGGGAARVGAGLGDGEGIESRCKRDALKAWIFLI